MIFHRKEPRDLTAAVRFYLDRDHEGAHSAEADVTATAEVLDAQLERYSDLPRTVDELDGWLRAGRGEKRIGSTRQKRTWVFFIRERLRRRSLADGWTATE